ncbi:hypothetical protein Thiowin_01024 [Thiorhodovibrio winogradskyi]|uniref:Uncharacterized protein n=1 Tax=Thiorhodovibrio winogradskyi TaxID=77007 RepID=A0ABZ0S6E6_9GAMM
MVVKITPPEARWHVCNRGGAQIGAAVGLLRSLAQQVAAHHESGEQLIIQIIAVGDDHDGWIGHGRVAHQLADVEGHQQAFAGALGVPDHADAAVATAVAFHAGQAIGFRVFAKIRAGIRIGQRQRAQGGSDRAQHGMELMVAREDLDRPGIGAPEDGEVAQQGEQTRTLQRALDQHRLLRRAIRGDGLTVGGAPTHEALGIGGQGADARHLAVGEDQRGIGAKQAGDLGLVGLELLVGTVDAGLLAAGAFQLEHHQRQAIDEEHHIGAAVMASLDDGELLHREPIVALRVVEVDQPHAPAAQGAVAVVILDLDAFGDQAMQAAVFLDQRRGDGGDDLALGLGAGVGWEIGVEPINGGLQASQ